MCTVSVIATMDNSHSELMTCYIRHSLPSHSKYVLHAQTANIGCKHSNEIQIYPLLDSENRNFAGKVLQGQGSRSKVDFESIVEVMLPAPHCRRAYDAICSLGHCRFLSDVEDLLHMRNIIFTKDIP